jgi:hypothetical protein
MCQANRHSFPSAHFRKWALRGVGVFLLYLLAGFFALPALIKWQLLKRLPVATHRVAVVRQVSCNPLVFSLTVRGLSLSETNGQPFAGFDEFYANFQLSSLFRMAWTFDEVRLDRPRAQIILSQDGQFNVAGLFNTTPTIPPTKTPPGGGLPRLLIFNLSITNGHVSFLDRSRKDPFHASYEPINIHLSRFTTRPGGQSPYSFEAAGDNGRRFAWSGSLTAQPLASTGIVQIAGIQVQKFSPYLEDLTRAQIAAGTLDISGSYSFAVSTNGIALAATNVATAWTELEVKDPDTRELVGVFPSVQLREGAFDLRARQVRAGSVFVRAPRLLVRRNQDGSINIPSLVLRRTLQSAAPPLVKPTLVPSTVDAPWIFTLDDYQLQDGSVQFEDSTLSNPFQSLLKPVTVRLQHFSNATNAAASLTAAITTESNESLNLTANFSLNPPNATTTVEGASFDLRKYQAYLAPFFRGTVTGGKADLTLEASRKSQAPGEQTVLTNATVRISGLRVRSPDGTETVMSAPELNVVGVSGDLAGRTLQVSRVESRGAELQIRREANGTLNLSTLLPRPTNSVTSSQATHGSSDQSWTLVLDQLALRDWALHWTDQQLPQPGKVDLDQLALTLSGLEFPSNAPVAVNLSTRVNGAGHLEAQGAVHPYTGSLETEISVAGLDLRSFQPWVAPRVKLGIERGVLSTTGRVELAFPGERGVKLHFKGSLAVENLETIDQVLFKELIGWKALTAQGINLDVPSRRASVEQVTLEGLKTSAILSAAGRLNYLAIFPPASTNPPPAAPAIGPSTSGHEPFRFELGALKLEKASIRFQDQSIEPSCELDLRELGGTIKGLSTQPNSTADVNLSGKVNEASPFLLEGKVNPLSQDLALKLVFTNSNLQLTPFTPYLEKYTGHPLNKGRLSLDLACKIEAKQLSAQNKIRIDQLVLGPRHESPTATKLPVKLAIALLKDSNGRIDLDLPLEGRLDDPQFKLGPVIVKVLVNLIVKAAASPFKLLGALVGGGEELSYVGFDPSQVQLLGAETNKLNKLVQALDKRPSLSLEIEGSIDPVSDRDALARRLVQNQIRLERLQELSLSGQAPASAENFQTEPADYERLLRAQIAKTFGTNLTEALHAVAERAAAATNSSTHAGTPEVGPGVWTRLASLFKGKQQRAATGLAHRAARADALLLQQNPELGRLPADEMEAVLASRTDVSPDSLRQLMEARAKAVQAYLLSAGQVPGERLLLIAPKTPDASFKGQARVLLSLD